MKKVFKILFFALFAYLIFTLEQNVAANTVNNLTMNIYIDNDGNADVYETWNCTSSKTNSQNSSQRNYDQTEFTHRYPVSENSEITNLSVSMNYIDFTTVSSWDSTASFSQKSYKAGLKKTSRNMDICFRN